MRTCPSKKPNITLELSVFWCSASYWFILKVKMGRFQQDNNIHEGQNGEVQPCPANKEIWSQKLLNPQSREGTTCYSESNEKPHVLSATVESHTEWKKFRNNHVTNLTHWGLGNAKWRWVSNLTVKISASHKANVFRTEGNGTVWRQGPLHSPIVLIQTGTLQYFWSEFTWRTQSWHMTASPPGNHMEITRVVWT